MMYIQYTFCKNGVHPHVLSGCLGMGDGYRCLYCGTEGYNLLFVRSTPIEKYKGTSRWAKKGAEVNLTPKQQAEFEKWLAGGK